jgi:xylulokinase
VPELAALVPDAVAAPSSVTFLPYLSGERTPLNDPDATGALIGLRRATGLPDLAQAVMEGVAMAFADCVHALRKAGTPIEAAYAVGGGARSRAWLRILASATGLTLLEPEDGDFGAAFGAARLAAACATGDTSGRIFAKPAIRAEVVPDRALAAAYAEKHQAYRAAYPRLRDLSGLSG